MRDKTAILRTRNRGASAGNPPGAFPDDVAERAQSQEARARLAAIVESSDDAIIGQTLEGVVTTWNRAAERLYGYTAAEAIGKPITLTVPPERMDEIRDYLSRVRHGERVDHIETVRVRKDGSRIDVSITVSPIRDDAGTIIGLSKSARDITERRRFEAELRRKNIELEIASRANDTFLASMSHELRTPLNSIIGFTGTLLMKLPGDLTGAQDRQLQLIQVNARHLLSLINDLLNLAKVRSGKAEVQREPIEIREVVEEVAATLRLGAEAKGLRFATSLPNDRVPINSDRRSLIQILMNLTTNAIKFTKSGHVRIEVERVENGSRRPEVAFHVADTGLGIAAADQKRLFGAFEQLHPGLEQEDGGSGLGLHLSQRMAGLLGGRIEFVSELDKGSTFTLFLPER
jgi:protein-histidine pros-kinase